MDKERLNDEIAWQKQQIELTQQHKERMERVLLGARGKPGFNDMVEHKLIESDERILVSLKAGLAFLESRKT